MSPLSQISLPLLLLMLAHVAVLAMARGSGEISCFAPGPSRSRSFGIARCHQMAPPELSRWQQLNSLPTNMSNKSPLWKIESKLSASKSYIDESAAQPDDESSLDDLQQVTPSNQEPKKRRSRLRFRERLRKVARVTSLALLHFTALRLRPGSAVAATGTAQYHDAAPPASHTRPASVVRMVDDDRKVVQCSIKPGSIQNEDGTFTEPTMGGMGTMLKDFGGEAGDADTTADATASPKKLSQKERRALRRQQRQKEKQWEEYGDEDEDDDEDFASGDGNLLADGMSAAAAGAAPGIGGPPGPSQRGHMSRPPGVTGVSDKAKSSIQAKVILIAGGGYALSCFGYEGWQWNKEQKKVETSIEILGEQAKELGLKLESNATATDEEIADELRNITDASEGGEESNDEGNENGDDDDDDDEDDDEPEPPRRRPRRPIRPSPDDDDDDDYGGGGMDGAGDGRPSADDLDRLNKMFKKS